MSIFSISSGAHPRQAGAAARPVRVLIVSENQPVPPDRRVLLEASALIQAGCTVSVICPLGEGQQRRETRDDVRYLRYRARSSPGGVGGYIIEYFNCLVHTLWLSLVVLFSSGFDIIHACNPPDLFFLIAAPYRLFGKRFVFDQHDLGPELFQSRFSGERPLLLGALRATERATYRVANAVISTNESYAAIARSRGKVPADRVFVVRNGPAEGWPPPAPADEALKRGMRHMVLYVGVMGPQDGVDVLVQAAAHVLKARGRTDVLFALIGDGDAVPLLRELVRAEGIGDNVHFIGWVSDEAILGGYLATSDACVCPEPSSPLNDQSSFIKVVEYMAAEKPVVAFDLPETRRTAGGAALYAMPGDVTGFADGIIQALDDSFLRERMAGVARERMPRLRWVEQVPSLLRAYDRALGDRHPSLARTVSTEATGGGGQ